MTDIAVCRTAASASASPSGAAGPAKQRVNIPAPARRVLMVLFHFPPLGGVAMPRNVRNVEYLPRFGWEPVVITARGAAGPLDPEALALVPPDARVFRAFCPEPRHLRRALDPIRSLYARLSPSPRALHSPAATEAADNLGMPSRTAEPGCGRPAQPLLWRLYHAVSFPDGQVSWLPFALAAAARAYRSGGFDVVYSTSSPITSHLVAGIVSRLAGVPWVAEFRDPWLGNPLSAAAVGPRPWFFRRLQVKAERWIILTADRVVFVSPSTTRRYRTRYPGAASMLTITNGHDRSDRLKRSRWTSAPGRFRIVYTGTLRPDELETFLAALAGVVARRSTLTKRLEVAFYGDLSDQCRAVADRYAASGLLVDNVRFEAYVPRRVALQALADADAGLIMLGTHPAIGQQIPAKLFDILGQSPQLLAILPPGDARDILEDLNWGVIAEPTVPDVERALEQLLATSPPNRVADPDGKYDRVALTGRLAETLNGAIEAVTARRATTDRPTSRRKR